MTFKIQEYDRTGNEFYFLEVTYMKHLWLIAIVHDWPKHMNWFMLFT